MPSRRAPARGDVADAEPEAAPESRFFDPKDGWLDVSGFLDTAYGFVPLVIPITEPAVGYGAAGALVFIDRKPPDQAGREQRPNVAVVGALGTENGTEGLFAAHLGTWMDGRLHTLGGIADADVNLDFFGLGTDRTPNGTASASSDGTPFYLRPFVTLRGVQALRYQGDLAGEVEAELRWQLRPRFSLVGFGGLGAARVADGRTTSTETVTAGGAGFRYLTARTYGLQLGRDVGFGPDEPILYVVLGSAWLRP